MSVIRGWLICLLVSGCTVSNPGAILDGAPPPDEQAGREVSQAPDQPPKVQRDGAPPDRKGKPELALADAPVAPDAGFSCPPGQAVGCSGNTLLRCNASGDGTVAVNCAPAGCDASLLRCTQCDPTAPPECDGNARVTCSHDGLTTKTTCPEVCQQGQCTCANPLTFYGDADGDGFGDPGKKLQACTPPPGAVTNSKDCDDADKNARPTQTQYFAWPSAGTKKYDYNCNGTVERQYPYQVACQSSSGTCTGSGWATGVPECGQWGAFVSCTLKPGQGCIPGANAKMMQQPCR